MPRMPERLAERLSACTDTNVVHLQTLRMLIGYVAVSLPVALVCGENLRDLLLADEAGRVLGQAQRVLVEGSISAYFHTGMRDVFVGALCAIGVFLICYRGYAQWDNVAAKVAGGCALLVALFPTPERSYEAVDTGVPAPDSVTLFSTVYAPDPPYVGWMHFGAAAVFFVTLALMSLLLFTRTGTVPPTPHKKMRNRVYVACGVVILVSVIAIALGKLVGPEAWALRTSYVFWWEAVAVEAFGLSWLTKAEVMLADRTG